MRPLPAFAAVLAVAVASSSGCAARGTLPVTAPAFRFPADIFAFANETLGEYLPDPIAARMIWRWRDPAPAFSLRCGNMARAVRQFRVHARFAPHLPVLPSGAYGPLIRDVLHRDPRRPTPAPDPVVIPGYPDLRSFSRDHEGLLKQALEGPWQTYVQRGNWRMIFPFTERHQRGEVDRLEAGVRGGRAPILHVVVYPQLTINHVVLVYAVDETPAEVRFHAYDPNDAERPVVLRYDRGARTFDFPRVPYFYGGPVKVYEIYDGVLY